MTIEQTKALTESLRLCEKLLQEMSLDRDRIVGCLNGELRRAYLDANETAEQEVKKIQTSLQTAER